MPVTGYVYNSFKRAVLMGSFKFESTQAGTTPIYVALVTGTYVPDIDTHDYFDDVSTWQVAGVAYTTPGAIVTITTSVDTVNNLCKIDGPDITWPESTLQARFAVLFGSVGLAAVCPLIAYFDFGADTASVAGSFTVAWHANGILNFT
jgi:hypothetical protein